MPRPGRSKGIEGFSSWVSSGIMEQGSRAKG
jgi:hypothetical protein